MGVFFLDITNNAPQLRTMSTTPRTDAEHAKTLTPAYEYVGAESEAWEWARTLEQELADRISYIEGMSRQYGNLCIMSKSKEEKLEKELEDQQNRIYELERIIDNNL